jgi:hypothetical protein
MRRIKVRVRSRASERVTLDYVCYLTALAMVLLDSYSYPYMSKP